MPCSFCLSFALFSDDSFLNHFFYHIDHLQFDKKISFKKKLIKLACQLFIENAIRFSNFYNFIFDIKQILNFQKKSEIQTGNFRGKKWKCETFFNAKWFVVID